jgi:DNA topoisomerase III
VSGHLFVAEKPSLAEAIAKARAVEIGAQASRTDGCWKVGPDAVTWLFGHFYELANPGEYDERLAKWAVDDLPIIPEKWRLVPRKGVSDQLGKVKRLLSEARKGGIIVNASIPSPLT